MLFDEGMEKSESIKVEFSKTNSRKMFSLSLSLHKERLKRKDCRVDFDKVMTKVIAVGFFHSFWLSNGDHFCRVNHLKNYYTVPEFDLRLTILLIKRKVFSSEINSSLSEANMMMGMQKKLRRLPPIFSKFLELPVRSDADVLVQENSDSFRCTIVTDDLGEDVRAQTIKIYPGVTKIVIRGSNVLEFSLDELEFDLWRYRLPSSTRPELARAVYVDGELVVTVPKGLNSDSLDGGNHGGVWGGGNGDFWGGMGRLVLVQ
ncbi:hypothetical protein HHK36_020595 [Tetracentron sinense]|uniref:SHSP domain-containing protein n=1 Tax=Tetracentron sinense TaxID=13715 RepID=A0A834Z020_TETSI|nr:hypothetical protein HHK36_020595 [Tetracentron sinense]